MPHSPDRTYGTAQQSQQQAQQAQQQQGQQQQQQARPRPTSHISFPHTHHSHRHRDREIEETNNTNRESTTLTNTLINSNINRDPLTLSHPSIPSPPITLHQTLHQHQPTDLEHNPYVDSFPRTTGLSPYGLSFPPNPTLPSRTNNNSGSGQTQTQTQQRLNQPNRRSSRAIHPRQFAPQRTTKTTQKLVLFPDEDQQQLQQQQQQNQNQQQLQNQQQQLQVQTRGWYDDTLTHQQPPMTPTVVIDDDDQVQVDGLLTDLTRDREREEETNKGQTEAEMLSKEVRTQTRLPRVTSYCVAEGYKLRDLAKFLRREQGVNPKMYDECLYVWYEGGMKLGAENMKVHGDVHRNVDAHRNVDDHNTSTIVTTTTRSDIFIFDYGVIVFWNLSQPAEHAYLGLIQPFAIHILPPTVRESEDFHFQYSSNGSQRIYNDMITLKSGNSLMKLTISHGIGQSVKLAYFENVMDGTIEGCIDLPRMMARYGDIHMTRRDVMKIVGKLFRLRVDVNLISNVLDTPELFWSEPELEGLYNAIRGYLEISQRAKLLNSRVQIVSDLLGTLTAHMNSNEAAYITWIIIVLIVMAVIVGAGEVWVKMLRLKAGLED
ncbi:hypothetical protein BC832DRAFT_553264 [Gaertneriomyces semiglobifer]|nr:hypothetical protein BC832DRAFT_553264 [Gaertneriomyces semiglobifer]